MTEQLKPVAVNDHRPRVAKGRLADKVAAIIAMLASGLAVIGSVIFFAGFVANDNHLAAVVSAFSFTALLGAFAIVPPLLIARIAWRAHKQGGGARRGAAFSLLLALPWVILSALLLAYTPLPIWISGLAFIISILLTIWAVAGLFLEK